MPERANLDGRGPLAVIHLGMVFSFCKHSAPAQLCAQLPPMQQSRYEHYYLSDRTGFSHRSGDATRAC
jgi:hypothetical protein